MLDGLAIILSFGQVLLLATTIGITFAAWGLISDIRRIIRRYA